MSKILIVVDMQNDFISGSLGTKEADAIVENVVRKIKEHDGPVIATFDTHERNYLETPEGKKLPVPHCIKMTSGWLLDEDVQAALFEKEQYKAITKPTFGSTGMVEYISNKFFKPEIELVGLCTDICVISNALLLKANFPDSEITVDASCCAGVTPEKHQAALEVMKSCQINVIGE